MGEQVVRAHFGASLLLPLQAHFAPLHGVNQQVITRLGQGVQCGGQLGQRFPGSRARGRALFPYLGHAVWGEAFPGGIGECGAGGVAVAPLPQRA